MSKKVTFSPGDSVTCTYRQAPELQPWIHPTWVGTVLDKLDPRAWDCGDMGAAYQHAPKLIADGCFRDQTPVLYPFGVRWDRTEALRPVIEARGRRELKPCGS